MVDSTKREREREREREKSGCDGGGRREVTNAGDGDGRRELRRNRATRREM